MKGPMKNRLLAITLLGLVPSLLPGPLTPARADEGHQHAVPDELGTVHFPISCNNAAQPAFTRGLALLHSFGYAQAIAAFEEATAADPTCAMARWGLAMSYYHAIWGLPTEAQFAAGQAAARQAAELGGGDERERDYIAAVADFYGGEHPDHVARVRAFEQAMAGVAVRHPEDPEAAIFHALSLLSVAYNAPPDKTYARQKQAAEILNRLLPLLPDHPGIAHYMIHSFDYPELAELALPAARAYAEIAPAAAHALHMPSHIFTRLALWPESIDANLASAATAQGAIATTHPGATGFNTLHAWDYLAYAYLQTGREDDARRVKEESGRVSALDNPEPAAGYALAAIPARYALERRAWAEAAALTVPRAPFPWEKHPYTEAIVHFARAVGAARSGDLTSAQHAVAELAAIQASLVDRKGFDWASQVEIQRRAAEGWLRRAEKKDEEALALLRSAAELEDASDKHPVTPGAVLPAREQLADLLAELGRPEEALAEYEASLRSAPGRFNSLWGGAQAAERLGEGTRAEALYRQLLAQCDGSTSARPELAAARERVAAK